PKNSSSIADVCHNEICGCRHEFEFHFTKLFLQIRASFIDNRFRFALMDFIIERRERADLRDAVHVKRLPGFLEHVDHFAARDPVTDAQASEAVDFRKGAQNDDVTAAANVSKCIRRTIEELEISFVEDDNDVFWNAANEG